MQCEIHGTRSMALFDSLVQNSGTSPRKRKCVWVYILIFMRHVGHIWRHDCGDENMMNVIICFCPFHREPLFSSAKCCLSSDRFLFLFPSHCYALVIVIYVAALRCCRVRGSCSLIAPFAANVVNTHRHTSTQTYTHRPEVNDFLPANVERLKSE